MKTKPQEKKRDSELESLLHSEHLVKVEKMAVGGAGVARISLADKKIVAFVQHAVPGDQLKIKISRVEKNYMNAEISEIISAGPGRRIADCKYFEKCGGCQWQNITEDVQLEQKELILKDLFSKFLAEKKYVLEPTYKSTKAFEYRNRIQLKHLENKLGYFKPETHDLVDIDDCLIAEKPLRDWLKTEKSKIKFTEKLRKYELKINADQKVEFYNIGAKGAGLSFSQINRFVNCALVEKTIDLLKNLKLNSITEFYAGSGNFTFEMAKLSRDLKIDAIELNPDLTRAAVDQVKALKLHKQIRFFTTKSEAFPLRNSLSQDLIFVDPPRQGCDPLLLKNIVQAGPKYILYISCHPVSLARDLQLLTRLGLKFDIEHLQIFDMFPQTDHFETLCLIKTGSF